MEARTGQSIGHYRLGRLVGRGNFSDVYQARHLLIGNQVAVKILKGELTSGGDERFLHEARLLGQLAHSHILRLLDAGIEGGLPYLAMEYAEGGSLRKKHLKGVELPLSLVVHYVSQLAEALQYAHARQIVHRDLKPENLLLCEDERLVLSDFGLATIVPTHTTSTIYAGPHDLAGSLAYCAPEQLQGQPEPATDQYALAICVHEWLTGKRPFSGTVPQICYQHVMQPPPQLSEARPDLPPQLSLVLLKALAKDPRMRFASISEFADALTLASLGGTPPNLNIPVIEPVAAPKPTRIVHLPAQLSSLIGREQERERLSFLLMQPAVRLLTMTGPGGVGKTSLALAVSREISDTFADGVCFVDLTSLRDPELVLPTCASALGFSEQGATDTLLRLSRFIADWHLLLVLDNFEQIVSAAPSLTELLSRCSRLTLLVTSREVLHVSGEYEFAVEPLPVPHETSHIPPEKLSLYPSVSLFVERVRAYSPTFSLQPSNAEAIARICARLDGLPLALELAAARLKLLSPKDLLHRLSHRLGILTTRRPDAPARQQTLRATIAWSYELLSEEEQRLFRCAAVFAGSFTIARLEALCRELGEDELLVLDGVGQLLDKSLLRRILGKEEDAARFGMLETIREFGFEMLAASGEEEKVGLAHTRVYVHLVEEISDSLTGAGQKQTLQLLEDELENLRTALSFALEHRLEQACLLVNNTSYFWYFRHLKEGNLWLRQIMHHLEKPDVTIASETHAETFSTAAFFAYDTGDAAWAEMLYRQAIEFFDALDLQADKMTCLYMLARIIQEVHADYAQARALFEQRLAFCKEHRYQRSEANTLHQIANITWLEGEYSRALSLSQEALKLIHAVGDQMGEVDFCNIEINICLDLGQIDLAEQLCERAIKIAEQITHSALGWLLGHQARIALTRGSTIDQAAAQLEAALALARESGKADAIFNVLLWSGQCLLVQRKNVLAQNRFEEALALAESTQSKKYRLDASLWAAHVHIAQGNFEQAELLFITCRTLLASIGTRPDLIIYLELCAARSAACGEKARAVTLWSGAAARRAELGRATPVLVWHLTEPKLQEARFALGKERYEAAWAQGEQARTLERDALLAWADSSSPIPERQAAPSTLVPVPTDKRKHGLPPDAVKLGITRRELDVLHLLSEGLTNKEIAEHLVLSVVTVNSYLRNIYSKLGVPTRTAAVRKAQDHHLI